MRCLIGFSRATVTQWATREDEKGLFDFGTGSMTNLSDWIKAGWRVEGNRLVRDDTPAPVVKKRAPRFKGDYSKWKAWQREMMQGPGLFVPLKTVNELNDHSFWRVRHRRSQQQHAVMVAALRCFKLPPLPVVVTFTRYSPGTRPLDSDGAFAAMKFVRDAIAKAYGVDDGGTEIEWAWPVKQERAPHYGVRVEFG